MNRSRLLIAITGAWSVRNILLSGLADRLSDDLKIVIALPKGYSNLGDALGSSDSVEFSAAAHVDVQHKLLQNRLGRAHRQIASPKMAYYISQFREYRRPLRHRAVSKAKYQVDRWLAQVDSRPARFRRLVSDEYAQWEKQSDPQIGEQLLSWNAKAVLFPEPHMPEEHSLARWAKKLGLKTIAVVRSFDNLTTKGRHPIQFDHYLVWNQQMRDELLRAYSDVPADTVHVVGTPQFQFYFSPEYTGSREEIARLYDLDPKRPLLLYAGNATGTVPHETLIVTQLCDALRRMSADQRPQLIVRPHPVERKAGRWEEVKQKYPEVRWSIPWEANSENVLWAVPQKDDVRILTMLVKHSDVVLNVASTMSLDAALCDTPVVCVNYALPPYEDFTRIINNYYDYEHYLPIVNSGAVRVARSHEELLQHVQSYLRNPGLDREKRARLVADKCGPDPVNAVELVAGRVAELIG